MQIRLFHAAAAVLTVLAIAGGAAAAPGTGQTGAPTVPGLASAALLPGWITAAGTRMIALDLQLQPGWKTYWRAPGDAGIPPEFDWAGSTNQGAVVFHWPAPEVIDSNGTRTLGFHDRLVLPIEVAPAAPGAPPDLKVAIDFGLCREICVPAHVTLTAPPPGAAPDPVIEAALEAAPLRLSGQAACHVSPIADGLRIDAAVRQDLGPQPKAALELMTPPGAPPVWVSEAEVSVDGPTITAAADFVPPSGEPFDLDPSQVRLTLIDADGRAVEVDGCAG
ncbi:hypothetical protein DRW48_02865 [Paracoccus suum]|uniref:Thiol:disulfide interchange protein DsbD N-terminal domain-containing protein n=1 Tax=Paracoccus suum TaxID=2259340 RepID=A0A344PHB7_9RHOB|nr:protein-disulfide reductase DsbD domain-containing protein [Paracoccus suum]AXC48772.1 hypothetical protein DRW48_02865 [Paracoccus suum]